VSGRTDAQSGNAQAGPALVRITFCLRRLPSWSHEAFLKYWYEEHAPLVRKHQRVLGILRYVQIRTDFGPLTQALCATRNAPEPFDGVAELWCESLQSIAKRAEEAAAQAAGLELLEDERRFIDFSRSPIWAGEGRTIFSFEELLNGAR
jgi:uncharacterized protein (TIGR02118 family)